MKKRGRLIKKKKRQLNNTDKQTKAKMRSKVNK